jgi:hypothetical protein
MTDDRTGVESDEAFLIRYLAERDEPCPLCGYDLRALTSPRCPECGEALRAGVGLAQPQVMAWVALTAPLVASAGIALFMLLLYAGRGSLPSDYRYPYLRWALVYFWGVAPPLGVFAVWRRRSILRVRESTKWFCAVIAWGVSVVAIVLLFKRR